VVQVISNVTCTCAEKVISSPYTSSWAAPQTVLDKLDACHRKHLRTITGHRWPNSLISNKALYKLCNTSPLSTKVKHARWAMFEHVLRMSTNTPAQQALNFALIGSNTYRARKGRHCKNLLGTLRADLKERGLGPLRSERKLWELRKLAMNRTQWREMKKDWVLSVQTTAAALHQQICQFAKVYVFCIETWP